MRISQGLLATAVILMAVAPALAETATAGSTTAVPEKSPNSLQTGKNESLSSKLSKSGGVITPKSNVDPGIKTPAPDPHPNSTPVIPPSATGGNTAK